MTDPLNHILDTIIKPLKPCPFCGGKPGAFFIGGDGAAIGCPECQARTNDFPLNEGEEEWAFREAAKLWERRLPSK